MRTFKLFVLFFVLSIFFVSTSVNVIETNKTHVIFLSDYEKYSYEKNPSLTMYKLLEKYSEEYSIPKHIIYNIAFIETRYHGPFDWGYKPNKGSYAGALGPMQIMPSTAKLIHKKRVSKQKLLNDIDFNIKTSAILLNKLYSKYSDWGKVCGAYNTGRPIINSYSNYCTSNLQYWNNWYFFQL